MATIAAAPRRTVRDAFTKKALWFSEGHAQGQEGKSIRNAIPLQAAKWTGPSRYVRTLFQTNRVGYRDNHLLAIAGMMAVCCIGLGAFGATLSSVSFLTPLSLVPGLFAYSLTARWLARQPNPSGLLKFAERVRRAFAYEADIRPSQQ